MTLDELSLPLPYEQARQYALVFAADLAQRLAEVQAAMPSQFLAQPVALADGRYLLCGDLLSEVGPGGLYAAGFSQLDAARFSDIEVLPIADAVALLPADPAI
jgi:hypothetical protein